MAWHGYFSYSGSVFVNVERTETYALAAGAPWFRPIYNTNAISTLEGETYVNSWVDEPPWGDPDNPDTYRFWGAYPLNITGLEDSTRAVVVTENIGDGATLGNMRAGSKSIVFETVLIGETEASVEAGLNWLKTALLEGPCDTGCGAGADLCYFSAEPCLDEGCAQTPEAIEACQDQYVRTLRNVKIVSGPTVTARRTTSDDYPVWVVTFTAVAGDPYQYGVEKELVEGFGVAEDPWVPDTTPVDWQFSDVAEDAEDGVCAQQVYAPIVDPLCPAIEVPPIPPSIPNGCFVQPEAWDRRWFTIPRKYIPYWDTVVPVVRVQTQSEVRGLRLRFYADVDADVEQALADPCGFCGDILFSYIPPNHTMVFDSITQTIVAEGPGGERQRADSLVFKTDGTPFDWPVLSCGLGYVVTVDFPTGQTGFQMPGIDLSLVPRGAA